MTGFHTGRRRGPLDQPVERRRTLRSASTVALTGIIVSTLVAACSSGSKSAESSPSTPGTTTPSASAPATQSASSAASGAPGASVAQTQWDKDELKALKLPDNFFEDMPTQLNVPQQWIDDAKKEGTVIVRTQTDPEQAKPIIAAFTQRYPGIKVDIQTVSSTTDRAGAALTAFKQGKFLSDVLVSFTQYVDQFESSGALTSLSDLPTWPKGGDQYLQPGATQFWGVAYNTNKLPHPNFPKTWDQLLSDPELANGALAVTNRPQLFLESLYTANGPQFVQDFINKLFNDVKPQRRTEGSDATVQLLGNGTFSVLFPADAARVKQIAETGAPVAFYMPSPIVVKATSFAVMSNAQHPNAAKLFTNWIQSDEGGLALFEGEGYSPYTSSVDQVKDNIKPLFPYPDQTLAGPWAVTPDEQVVDVDSKVEAMWKKGWGS